MQEEFRVVAGRMNGGDPITTWRRAKEQHPEPGQLVNVAQEQVQELAAFLQRQGIVSLPEFGTGRRGSFAGVLSLGVCEHVDARGRSRANRVARFTT